MIYDFATGQAVLGGVWRSVETPYADPLTAYATWAAELGLSSTGTPVIQNETDNDFPILQSTNTLTLIGSAENRIIISPNGGIGLYLRRTPHTVVDYDNINYRENGFATGPPFFALNRVYLTKGFPAVFISVRAPDVNVDRLLDAKIGLSGSATIFFARWAKVVGGGTAEDGTEIGIEERGAVEAAFAFVPGFVEIVARNVSTDAAYLQVFGLDELFNSDANYEAEQQLLAAGQPLIPVTIGAGVAIDELVQGVSTHYLTSPPAQGPGILDGGVETNDWKCPAQPINNISLFGLASQVGGGAYLIGEAQPIQPAASFGVASVRGAVDSDGFLVADNRFIFDELSRAAVLLAVEKSATSPYTDPLAAYAAWASTLGQAPGGVAIGIIDDEVSVQTTGQPILMGSVEAKMIISSEGGIGLYRSGLDDVNIYNTADNILAPPPQIGYSRFSTPDFRPSLVFGAKVPSVNTALFDAKFDSFGETAIFYGIWAAGGNAQESPVEVAFRFTTGGVEAVARQLSAAPAYFQVFRFAEGFGELTAFSGRGAYTDALVQNVTTHYQAAPLVPEAAGFSSTSFGPVTSDGGVSYAPATAASVAPEAQFGVAAQTGGDTYILASATSLAPDTLFGVTDSSITRLATGAAPSTFFAVPTGLNGGAASGFSSTAFGLASYPVDLVLDADGFQGTYTGTHFAYNVTSTGLGRLAFAAGSRTSTFGLPRGFGLQVGTAAGSLVANFGVPDATRRFATPQGFSLTMLGAHMLRGTYQALSYRGMRFGLATASRTLQAPSMYREARFGLPAAFRSGTYLARAAHPRTQLGRPVGFSRFNYPATGFGGAALGLPACRQQHHITHIAPGCRFGQSILRRALTC